MYPQLQTVIKLRHYIEVRDFGLSRCIRVGRNPKTGESLNLSAKYLLHFKPGKELRHRVDESRLACQIGKVNNHSDLELN